MKKEKWDCRSRTTNDKYKQEWNRIFNGSTKETNRETDEIRPRSGDERRQEDSN